MKSTTTPVWAKTLEEHREHFIMRLKERYNIVMSEEYYMEHCVDPGKKFKGLLSRNGTNTLGYAIIANRKVYLTYIATLKCYTTCYPPEIETSDAAALRSCFNPSIRKFAFLLYIKYLEEVKTIPTFTTEKDAALFLFSNTLFPSLHIDKYKRGNVNILKVMGVINGILKGENRYVELTIKRKTNTNNNE